MSTTFKKLPLDIFAIVLQDLYNDDFQSFLALRLTCRDFTTHSEDLFFRNITLTCLSDIEEKILTRMQKPGNTIAIKVRKLKFAPRRQITEETVQRLANLQDCWRLYVNLQDIIWESQVHLPPQLLSVIMIRPQIRLTYVNDEWRRRTIAIDKDAISLSNLHSVDFTISLSDNREGAFTELADLKDCMLKAVNLKRLRLCMANSDIHDPQERPHFLPFEDGDHIPPLEELIIISQNSWYSPTVEHCQIWARCMDWSKLHTLDFGNGSPPRLLTTLTGRVPQLKTLCFGDNPTNGATRMLWNCTNDVALLVRFLESIQALENVTMWSRYDLNMRQTRATLLSLHGQTLKTLHAPTHRRFKYTWDPPSIFELRDKAPMLLELSVRVRMHEVRVEGIEERETVWPGIVQETKELDPLNMRMKRFMKPPKNLVRSLMTGAKLSSSKGTKLGPEVIDPYDLDTTRLEDTAESRTVHSTLTSFPELTSLRLEAILESDTYQLIDHERRTFAKNRSVAVLKHKVARQILIMLWRDSPRIQFLQVAFFIPKPSSKIWTYKMQHKWIGGERRVVLDVEEEGYDYDP